MLRFCLSNLCGCVKDSWADLCITHASWGSARCGSALGVPLSAHSILSHCVQVHACVWFMLSWNAGCLFLTKWERKKKRDNLCCTQKSGLHPCRLLKSPFMAWCKSFLPWELVFWLVCSANSVFFKNYSNFFHCIIGRGIPDGVWQEPPSWEMHVCADTETFEMNSFSPFLSPYSLLPQRHKLSFYPGPVT